MVTSVKNIHFNWLVNYKTRFWPEFEENKTAINMETHEICKLL